MFTHLSEDCNSEELAREIHQEYIMIWGHIGLFKDIEMRYAKQEESTEL